MRNIKTDWVSLKVDENNMEVFVVHPSELDESIPGIILFQEAFGVNSHIQEVAQRLAQEGFYVMAPELFHRTAPPHFIIPYDELPKALPHMEKVTPLTLEQDVSELIGFFNQQTNVKKNCLGSLGFCMGGKSSFITNALFPLKAAVSFYGGQISHHLPLAAKQQGHLLTMWAGLDEFITFEERQKIVEALYKNAKDFITLEFSKTNHGFFCDARKTFHSLASQQAWAITLTFLKNYLI